ATAGITPAARRCSDRCRWNGCTASTLKPGAKAKMKPSTGCFGITKRDCTRHCITSAQCSSNKPPHSTRKHPRVEREAKRSRLWKSRKAKTAFQLSHSHDDYELYSVMGYGF